MSEQSTIIEVRVHALDQLFESMDPSPFHERDLSPSAEEYIVDSVKELHAKVAGALELRIHLDAPVAPAEVQAVESAIRAHFARHALHLRRTVRELLRDGWRSLGIGIAFLVLFFLLGQIVIRIAGVNPWSTFARESLLIGGWVALWRPLEILLYAWWPIVRERRQYERLSRISVHVRAA